MYLYLYEFLVTDWIGSTSYTWVGSTDYTWIADFNGDGRADMLFLDNNHKWHLATYPSGGPSLVFSEVGDTSGFGSAPWGCPIWPGDFNGDGKAEMLFFYPGDHNWWLGTYNGQQIVWSLAGNTAGFGHGINDGRPFWVGRFSTPTKSEILFFFPGDDNWWLGTYNGQQLVWTSAGNTSSFGPIADGRPFRIGDFNDDGKAEVLFYHPDDNAWQLGQWAGGTLHWNQVASTVGLWKLA